MGKYDGKLLLELGTNIASVDIVKYARQEGAYVIVSDYLPTELSEAKQFADETAMISTLDTARLIEFAREKHVDGVYCGVSEAHLLSVYEITKALGLPCYFEMEQWNVLQNKHNFRESCERHGIQITKGYLETDEHIQYPVIVKPADNGASTGITVCYDERELRQAVKLAKANSAANQAVIEEYMTKDEVMVYYTVIDGEVKLSAMCDRIMRRFDREKTQLPIEYDYPSKYIDVYIEKFDVPVRNYIRKTGVRNGLLAFQAFMDGDSFIPFDPTFRLDGTSAYHFVEHENGVSAMKQLVNYQILGRMCDDDSDLDKEDPHFKRMYCEIPILLGKGVISRVEGMEEVSKLDGIIYISKIHKPGDMLKENCHFKQMLCRVLMAGDSIQELRDKADRIRSMVRVFDEQGKSMNLL